MLEALLVAVAVLIVVGLICLLVGGILKSLAIPIVAAIGAFLVQWAWVIGFAAALLSFVGGFSVFGIGKR